jgi:hypothetical protein
MRLLFCVVGLAFALAASAKPSEENLTSGELYGHLGGWTGNAYTVPKGDVMFHPLLRSGIGLSDTVDLKLPILGMLLGPSLSSEIGIRPGDKLAVSFEPRFNSAWNFGWQEYGLLGKVTFGAAQKTHFTLGVHTVYRNGYRDTNLDGTIGPNDVGNTMTVVRPEASLEFRLTDVSRFILLGRTNVVQLSKGKVVGAFGALYALGNGPIGLSAGMNFGFLDVQGVNALWVQAFDQPLFGKDYVILPGPHFQLWFRI